MLKHTFRVDRRVVATPLAPRRKKPRSQSHSSQESTTTATTPTPSSGCFSRSRDRWMQNQSDGEEETGGGAGGETAVAPMADEEDDEEEDDTDDDPEHEIRRQQVDNNNNNNNEDEEEDDDDDDDDEVLRRSARGAAATRRATTTTCGLRLQEAVNHLLPNKVSRLRPPSGAEGAVRRWNSFHSTRGECHPNKFRRDRKAASQSPPPPPPLLPSLAISNRQSPLTGKQTTLFLQQRSVCGGYSRSAISAGLEELHRGQSDTGLAVEHKRAASIW